MVAFLWLPTISFDIVFEVEAHKYKAVAQLIKTVNADCWIHSFLARDRFPRDYSDDAVLKLANK